MSDVSPPNDGSNNVLKRKNEDSESIEGSINGDGIPVKQTKRVAFNPEELDLQGEEEDKKHTAPTIGILIDSAVDSNAAANAEDTEDTANEENIGKTEAETEAEAEAQADVDVDVDVDVDAENEQTDQGDEATDIVKDESEPVSSSEGGKNEDIEDNESKEQSKEQSSSDSVSKNEEEDSKDTNTSTSEKPAFGQAQTVQQILQQAALLSDLAPTPASAPEQKSSASGASDNSGASGNSGDSGLSGHSGESDVPNVPNVPNVPSAPKDFKHPRDSRDSRDSRGSRDFRDSRDSFGSVASAQLPAAPTRASGSNSDYRSLSSSSKPFHVEDDASFISVRIICPVKEASTIVGKQGSKINHLREKANVRIQVSENIRDVPERIVTVRGTPENIARAYGLIVRTILSEPEDEPANINSQQYTLKLLIPHALIGFLIGKQGSKFREIEENSAAKLKAAEQPLPYSTDRVLSVSGVGDAIHIAVYYLSLLLNDHQDVLKKHKVILYNPANYRPEGGHANDLHQHQRPPRYHQQPPSGLSQYGMNPMFQNRFDQYQRPPPPHQQHQQQQLLLLHQPQLLQLPYDFSSMFQPAVQPQQPYGGLPPQQAPPAAAAAIPGAMSSGGGMNPQPYTDEFNNTLIGEVIIHPPLLAGDKYNQDVYVANSLIGSVIGRGGNNIKHIRENSGCTYVRIEPDKGQSIMLGGRGLTNIRRLTLTGSLESFDKAIYLINQRINADRERNSR
ncbi:conserved hypothetical protein [Lodderomyces elongisporus NRRL YB-4239]|uniref:K Homology domain-containing protein n=1 Tax=Lodderomyces elongisporus (strain ATCC 11503 / CBS 2605 / JCM 1781 / NBRC 1676 / NRRL YB-4239) TaxID=379508 RepID=A5E5U3_LODEL|nr:conserved hypothetical protein [Lodderomyces elongisporus NRRL YB-4239]